MIIYYSLNKIADDAGPPDRRHTSGPGSSQHNHPHNNHQHPHNHQNHNHQHQAERRPAMPNNHAAERRHLGPLGLSLSDRRHISPPLHINICDSAPTMHTLSPVGGQQDGRSTINIDYSQRRNGRGGEFFILFIYCSWIFF